MAEKTGEPVKRDETGVKEIFVQVYNGDTKCGVICIPPYNYKNIKNKLHPLQFLQAGVHGANKLSTFNTRMDPNIKGVPVDYSFRKVYSLSELENGTPREYRVGIPKKSSSGKFISSSLWANYNHLTDLKEVNSLVKVSFHRPEMIAWLDVSFNNIEIISNELLSLANLKILYLHGNKIKFFIEVGKLKPLKYLRTLTLHGNPIEETPNYRSLVVKTLPQLINFDFSLVSK